MTAAFKCAYCDSSAVAISERGNRVCSYHNKPHNNEAGEPPSPRKPDLPRYSARNASRQDHIKRLRQRVADAHTMRGVRGVLQGLLDFIADDGGGE